MKLQLVVIRGYFMVKMYGENTHLTPGLLIKPNDEMVGPKLTVSCKAHTYQRHEDKLAPKTNSRSKRFFKDSLDHVQVYLTSHPDVSQEYEHRDDPSKYVVQDPLFSDHGHPH